MGKPVICVSNNSKWSRYQGVDMIMKTHKLLWGILFSYQIFGASSVLRLGTNSLIAKPLSLMTEVPII